jgi:hypothetical protein
MTGWLGQLASDPDKTKPIRIKNPLGGTCFCYEYLFMRHGIFMYFFLIYNITSFDGQCGVAVGILAYYARGRGFDSRTVQTYVCLYWVWVFLCIICMYLQKKSVCKYEYVFIRYLKSIKQAL